MTRVHISVDKGLCIGCTLCADMCPRTFRMEHGKAEVLDPLGHSKEDSHKTAHKCPTGAIRVSHAEWAKHIK